jgi:hypothetical protein
VEQFQSQLVLEVEVQQVQLKEETDKTQYLELSQLKVEAAVAPLIDQEMETLEEQVVQVVVVDHI